MITFLKVLGTTAKAVGGILLSLMGSWLGVVCIGGLLTLSILSVFHIGVLLSLGCIGVCLLVAGACVLHQRLSKATSPPSATEADALAIKRKEKPVLAPSSASSQPIHYTAPFHPSPETQAAKDKKRFVTTQDVSSKKTASPNPFDDRSC